MVKYKTSGLDCWCRAKELRQKYYQDYYKEAHNRGALLWEGRA
jgi:hypothetical protein